MIIFWFLILPKIDLLFASSIHIKVLPNDGVFSANLIKLFFRFSIDPYYSICSSSILVIIEYVKGSCKKLPSDSSDSNTHHSPLPSLAEFPIEFITPPLIVVGSSFDFEKIVDTIDVVVVFP